MEEKDHLEKEEIIDQNTSSTASNESAEDAIDQPETVGATAQKDVDMSVEDKLTAENQELKDKYLRLYSEFENYRRRTAKERLELIKTAAEDVVVDLISVVDDFERALKVEGSDVEALREGNLLIYNKLMKVLESKGLKAMDELVGKEFDAETQEAITMIPAPTEELKGKVIDVVEKGYTLGEKVIRYAKVVIGS
ncbi:MAG TPA: nucleotide exchange factor GrpE [Cyclobacteriaceae bacterium]|nr:nucleotide exchange factor GrpE [Cyclobacteriaceae bacterium]